MTGTMTSQLPTVYNVPRDIEKIKTIGIFGHRKLADDLIEKGVPVWTSQLERNAFITAEVPVRSARLLEALQQWDAMQGNATQQAPAPAAPVMMQQMQLPVQVPQQQATEPPREPSNEGVRRRNNTPTSNTALNDQVTLLSTEIGKVAAGLSQVGTGVATGLKNVHEDIADLRGRLTAIQSMQHVMLGMLTTIAQSYLGEGCPALVEVSVGQANEVVELVSKMGKATQ